MLSAKDVRSVTFSKQVNGYRREEVDVFLDKVESDYENYERMLKEMNAKVHELQTKISESKDSETSLQSVLLSAQKLADSIVSEAKEKSAKIIEETKQNLEVFKAREKELSNEFDKKAQARKQIMRDELDKIIDAAKVNRDNVAEATEKTVKKQAELYNRLKLETAAFKAEIMDKYKKQVELIAKLPDTIPADPEEIAAAIDLNVDDLSDKDKFIDDLYAKSERKIIEEETAQPEDIITEIIQSLPEEKPAETKESASSGFVVNTELGDDTKE
jgi:cell division initiation protein